MLYWKPEQPPGLTPMRSARSSSPSWAMRVLTFSAALSVMATMVVSSFCCISTSRAVVGLWARKLLHRKPYTSTPLFGIPAGPPTQRLGELRPAGGHVLPGADEQRGRVHNPESPAPVRQSPVCPERIPVSGSNVFPVLSVRGVEVVRVGKGEPRHRRLLHASGPGEEQYPLGRGQRRRVGDDVLARWQHVAQPTREVPVEVLGPAAGQERPLGDEYGGHEQHGQHDEQGPHWEAVLPEAVCARPLPGAIRVLLLGRLLAPSPPEPTLVQVVVLRLLVLAGRRKLGARGVRLHRGWHGEAGGRVEGVPADAGEVGLHPRVHVATPDQVLTRAHVFSGCGPVDHARGHAHVAKQERHRGRELGAEPFLAVAQELLYGLVSPAVTRVQVVGKAAVVGQVLFDRARLG